MRQHFFILLLLITGISSYGQMDSHLKISGFGNLYSSENSPFYFHSNQRGRVDEKSFYYGLVSLSSEFQISDNKNFELGLGVLYKDGYEDELKFDEAYFAYNSEAFSVVIGKKQRQELYRGLSATNTNILWSLNAAPLPGIGFKMNEPLFVNGNSGLGFTFSWEEYLMDDDRYVPDTRLHHKSAHLVYRNRRNLEISLGLQHFSQWAGTSPEFGTLPKSFDDYTKVITGFASEEVGDQEVNSLGNQIGSYELKVNSKINDIDVEFLYNHIFEDGSGLKLGNFPDGRYAIYFEDNRDTFWGTAWLKAFMYEFYYTKNQSRDRKSSEVDGADNYFNNNLYKSGWTYQNLVIGTPFILTNDDRFRIGTNIITVHHLGLSGNAFDNVPYRLLLSYRKNYGRKDSFFPNTREIFSSMLEVDLVKADYSLQVMVGADVEFAGQSNLGAGVKFSKSIF